MAGLVSQATLEQIRSASDIVDVIGAALPLKRAGANFVTLCPFHREKSPSFNVNPQRQIFHCFGCHKGGDVFRFIQEYENLSFVEAVRRLADRAGIQLEYDKTSEGQQTRYLKETLWQIHEQITQRWHAALLNDAAGQIARDYLTKRGVSEEAIKLFRLGYAPDLWDDTVNWAKSKDYDLGTVEQAGLVIRKEASADTLKGGHQTNDSAPRYYDRFRGRLMFPICDEQGRVIAFSGRILTGDEKTAKYVNSPETPIFTKSKVFFGLDKSKRAILEAEFAIICEGQLDLIACYMAGVRNIVAPQGTAFTPEHARILKRYVNEVVLCFDSDSAGQSAAIRVMDSLLQTGLAIRVASIPAPHDPDSFIKEFGGAAFHELIQAADGFFDFYLGRLCATNDAATDKGRLAIVSQMGEALAKTGSPVLVDTYASKTAQRLGVSMEAVRAEFKRAGRGQPIRSAAEENVPARADNSVSPQDRALLHFLLKDEEYLDWMIEKLDPAWVSNAIVREIVTTRFRLHREQSWQGIPAFSSMFDDESAKQLIHESVMRPIVENKDGMRHQLPQALPKPFEQLAEIVATLRAAALAQPVSELPAEAERKVQLRRAWQRHRPAGISVQPSHPEKE